MYPQQQSCKQRRRRGQAIIEVALMAPWIYFVFIGVFDMGFYCYALMTASNAARIAALQVSDSYSTYTTDAALGTKACLIALNEMQDLPNVYGNTSTCGSGGTGNGNLNNVNVTAVCTGAGCGGGGGTCTGCSALVTVTYVTLPLIPIPGFLASQFTFVQTAEMAFGS
jgi:Flp pilus assembly protein TadG